MNTAKLRGLIAERGLSQESVAKRLGMTSKTFYTKMKRGSFYLSECDKLIEILAIEKPQDYFFADEVK